MQWNKVERLWTLDGNIQVRATDFKSEKVKIRGKNKKTTREIKTEHNVGAHSHFYLDFRTSSSTSVTTSVMVGRS